MGFEGYDDWKQRDEADERLEREEGRLCLACEGTGLIYPEGSGILCRDCDGEGYEG